MYHAIPATRSQCRTPLDIPQDEFASHLDTLAEQGWRVMGLSAAIAARRAADPGTAGAAAVGGGPDRLLALTIDDAYADAALAAHELAARGMSGSLYVPTDFPGGSRSASGRFAHPLLSWAGLRELAGPQLELGSHSRSHRPLDVLPTGRVRDELVTSREVLHEHTGVLATSLCYPYGYTSRRVRRLAVEAGYTNACTVGRRIATGSDSELALPRLQPLPGLSAGELVRLVTRGEPGLAPVIKRYAQPAWRGVRFGAHRVGVTLT
jgi:peptidoglycan/xylan/chitin deacetylase (PgdA/CDA1 family)